MLGTTRLVSLIVITFVLLGATPQPAPAQTIATLNQQVRLPLLVSTPTTPRFGAQISDYPGFDGASEQATRDLGFGWARVAILSWAAVEPVEGAGYNWAALAQFEQTVRTLRAADVRVEAVVADSPSWATINVPYVTSCGAIRTDKFASFGRFMAALAKRYSQPEFGVLDWELGNEIDVDPSRVPPNNGFGCWGKMRDPFYGGQQYGEMLKVVTPQIRATGVPARVWHAGLLLGSPYGDSDTGTPALFLKGVLEAGAAPYFDVLPIHSYPNYLGAVTDPQDSAFSPWSAVGGQVMGKLRYVRGLLEQYDVQKPIVINEFAFLAPSAGVQPDATFYRVQASQLVRDAVRALDAGVEGVYWYKVGGPDWRGSSLIMPNGQRSLTFTSFRQLITMLGYSARIGPVDYGEGREAYAFTADGRRVEVVWARKDELLTILLPRGKVRAAYTRDGLPIPPQPIAGQDGFIVGYEPIYLLFGE